MNKYLGIILTVFVATLMVFLIVVNRSTPLSEDEMKTEYACDRITADVRETDVYCNDYDRYVDDFKNGSLIE